MSKNQSDSYGNCKNSGALIKFKSIRTLMKFLLSKHGLKKDLNLIIVNIIAEFTDV